VIEPRIDILSQGKETADAAQIDVRRSDAQEGW